MASIRSTLVTIWMVLMLFLVVAGVTFGVGWWKQRSIRMDLDAAEARLKDDKPAEAELLLAAHLDQGRPTGFWVDQALELRFRALSALADKTADPKQKAQYIQTAQVLADRVLDPKKPWVKKGQAAWAQAHLVLAEAALSGATPKPDAALPHIQAVLEMPEGSPGREEAILDRCRIDMSNGEVSKAQKDLSALLEKLPADAPARSGVEYALGLCNMSVLKSAEPQEGDQIYAIQKGDSLDRLRKKFKVSPEILQAINHPLLPTRLTIGRRIKIPNLDFAILVNKANNTLTLYNHGKFFKKYRVRTGKMDYLTPVGDYRINNKMVDPPWTNPKEGKTYGRGEAGNELGCRWMEFRGSLGIHEAVDPKTIGTYGSNGCVGMAHDDVIELYDLVPKGTPVKIVNQAGATPLEFPGYKPNMNTMADDDAAADGAVAADGTDTASDEAAAAVTTPVAGKAHRAAKAAKTARTGKASKKKL